jgi:hypothetical protein
MAPQDPSPFGEPKQPRHSPTASLERVRSSAAKVWESPTFVVLTLVIATILVAGVFLYAVWNGEELPA